MTSGCAAVTEPIFSHRGVTRRSLCFGMALSSRLTRNALRSANLGPLGQNRLLGQVIAAYAVRHLAALLIMLDEPPP